MVDGRGGPTGSGGDSDDGDDGRGRDPAHAFSLLGDATRLAIVTELYDAALPTPVGFADLYDRVDLSDTAQFNYHLGRLVPHFVAKTDAGYALTERGKRIARAIVAGTYTGGSRRGPFALDGECYACGEPALSATYADERLAIDCEACEAPYPSVPVPPSVVRGHDPDDVGAAVDRWARSQIDLARAGSCPTCGGPVEPLVVTDPDYGVDFAAVAAFECRVCSRRTTTTFGALAFGHPAVEAFHDRRGESLSDRRFWELGQYVAHENVTVRSRDPWRVRVSFAADGDTCHVAIDEELSVTRVEVVSGTE